MTERNGSPHARGGSDIILMGTNGVLDWTGKLPGALTHGYADLWHRIVGDVSEFD